MPTQTGTVIATNLNLRDDPSTSLPPRASLRRGTKLEILGRQGGWYRVRAADQTGFVHSDFVLLDPLVDATDFLCHDDDLCTVGIAAEPPIADRSARTQLQRSAAQTWNRYGGLLAPLSDTVGVPRASAVAVLCVESSGRGFVNGRMVIRFENHVFWDQWGRNNVDAFRAHFKFDATKRWTGHQFRDAADEPWRASHAGQDSEWDAFAIARSLHEPAALRSISMGAPQIMGFNHARIGYESVREMFDHFTADDRFQILGMFDFIKGPAATSSMLEALRREQYEKFATGYNGTGQAAEYGARIRAHVDAFELLHPRLPTLNEG